MTEEAKMEQSREEYLTQHARELYGALISGLTPQEVKALSRGNSKVELIQKACEFSFQAAEAFEAHRGVWLKQQAALAEKKRQEALLG